MAGIITDMTTLKHVPAWQREFADSIRDPRTLLERLGIDDAGLHAAARRAPDFPVRVPEAYLRAMRPGDPEDPLFRQVFPFAEEAHSAAGFDTDPVGDLDAMARPGLLHKYRGRVLLVVTGACAVNCRYCFRRHFPYAEANAVNRHLETNLEYIAEDDSINEVILSGGDPLVLSDERLAPIARRLAAIPHLRRLRIHTRLPVVLPARVDDRLLAWIREMEIPVVTVIHANHANELTPAVGAALDRLAAAGCRLLNQAVLLRGVNDSPRAQVELGEALFDVGVTPYYLHCLDRVEGAAHYAVDDDAGARLLGAVRARLPGYLVPRLVREHAGEPAKTPVIGRGD